MSEDAHETETHSAEALWQAREKRRRELEDKMWKHQDAIVSQDHVKWRREEIRWDRDVIHWRNIQQEHKIKLVADCTWMAVNIVLAICAILKVRER